MHHAKDIPRASSSDTQTLQWVAQTFRTGREPALARPSDASFGVVAGVLSDAAAANAVSDAANMGLVHPKMSAALAFLAERLHLSEVERLSRRYPFLLLPGSLAAPKNSSVRRGTGQSDYDAFRNETLVN